MIIDGMNSEQIKAKLKEFCNKIIVLGEKNRLSSEEVYDAVLLSSDWINALSKLWKQTKDQNVYDVALAIEKIHEHTECAARRLESAMYDHAELFVQEAKEEAKKLIAKLDS